MDEDPVAFRIGDFVTWRGRLCVLRGIDPMSVAERRADLEECGSGDRHRPLLQALSEAPGGAG